MLNASPLNAVPLNGLASAAAEPEYIVRGQSFVWALRVLVDGVNRTAQLTGTVTVDREEGAAGIAGFNLFIAPGVAVVPPDWKGRPVSIDYISTSQGATTEARRYAGQISIANWNPVSRVLTCECSDQLQQRVEGMTVAAIDSLVGGFWSADVFEEVEGRSHWDYARERLSTRPVGLDCSPTGELRVTSWYAAAPHFIYGPGTTLYQTVELQQADLDRTTNRVEIEFSYRYSRLWQRNKNYSWQSPVTEGQTGLGGFCLWRANMHPMRAVRSTSISTCTGLTSRRPAVESSTWRSAARRISVSAVLIPCRPRTKPAPSQGRMRRRSIACSLPGSPRRSTSRSTWRTSSPTRCAARSCGRRKRIFASTPPAPV